jgi:hypothetical protein
MNTYGKRYPGSGSVNPAASMRTSKAPWHPDQMEDVEIQVTVPRSGPFSKTRDRLLAPRVETRKERRYVR